MQPDQVRHAESARRRLRELGYYPGGFLPLELRGLARAAGWCATIDAVSTTAAAPPTKARHNGHSAPRGPRTPPVGRTITMVRLDGPPPPSTARTGCWVNLLPELQAAPGVWFDCGIQPRCSADHLRQKGVRVEKRAVGEPGLVRVYLSWPADSATS